jgi:hypothetical protein
MATIQIESWEAAKSEGLAYFWANMHLGNSIAFVAQSWEDGGFAVDKDGNPTRDVRGNTVANHKVEQLDSTNAAHVAQVEEWYG